MQDCPRGAAGKPTKQRYAGKVNIGKRVAMVSHAAGGYLLFP